MTRPTLAESRDAARKADAARSAALYGAYVDDVAFLRRRGFVVTREGQGARVGNRLLEFAEVRAMTKRWRPVEAPVVATSDGRHVGDTEAYVKPGQCNCGRPVEHMGRCWARRAAARAPAEQHRECKCGRPATHFGQCWARRGKDGPAVPTCTACGERRSRWSKGLCAKCANTPREKATEKRLDAIEGRLAKLEAAR